MPYWPIRSQDWICFKNKQYDSVCVCLCAQSHYEDEVGVTKGGSSIRVWCGNLQLGIFFPSCCCLAPCDCDTGHVRETNPLATTKPAAAPGGTTDLSLTPTKTPRPSTRGAALMSASARCVKFCIWRQRRVEKRGKKRGSPGFRNQAWIIVVNF